MFKLFGYLERHDVCQRAFDSKQGGVLNCDDWIKDKSGVFRQGWTLLDDQGYLRTGI